MVTAYKHNKTLASCKKKKKSWTGLFKNEFVHYSNRFCVLAE